MQIVCGEDDSDFLRKFVTRKTPVEVLVNGVDLDYFRAAAANEKRAKKPTALFCGAMDYNPNIDALRWYFSEVHERLKNLVPELEVLIVGKNPTAEIKGFSALKEVTVTGGVPDVRPYYRRAWLQIVPLRIGGGSRLKIVESLAMGTPVVSTTIGAQGLGLRHNCDILLADNAVDFARETARALRDETLRKNLAELALTTVQSRLSWPILGKQLSALYDRHFGRSLPVGSREKIQAHAFH
jgi:glycosyltransferase involved in cell wall biosynthesis